jgi:hypothetical protein
MNEVIPAFCFVLNIAVFLHFSCAYYLFSVVVRLLAEAVVNVNVTTTALCFLCLRLLLFHN